MTAARREDKKARMSAASLCLVYDRESIPLKSQQHGCLNKTRVIRSVGVLAGIGKSRKVPPLDEALQKTNSC